MDQAIIANNSEFLFYFKTHERSFLKSKKEEVLQKPHVVALDQIGSSSWQDHKACNGDSGIALH